MMVYEETLKHEFGNLKFPSDVVLQDETKDFIQKLLHPTPNKRLGVRYPGINGVKHHEFFKGFDWKGFAARKLTAPIIPAGWDDANHPKEYNPRLNASPDDITGWTLGFADD